MRITLGKQDILEMAYGACLMGGGGGGSLDNGTVILDEFARQGEIAVEMVSTDEMKEGEFSACCGGFGSPLKFKERGANCLVEPTSAFQALERQSYAMNRQVRYIMPVEYGALNTVLPLMVAMKCGVPVLDADGSGRAVPSLQTLLFGVNDVPLGPFVMTDGEGNVTTSCPKDCLDATWLDRVGRYMCQVSDMVMGFGGGIATRQQVEERLVPGAYTYAQKVGRALMNATAKGLDITEELKKVMECREFFRGKLTKFEADAHSGWDWGSSHYEGCGPYAGKNYRIDYQNESLVAWEDDKVLMTAPDLICTIDLGTGKPLSNADLREGMDILSLGIPAPKNWFKTDRYLTCWQSHFDAVGYKGGVIRY